MKAHSDGTQRRGGGGGGDAQEISAFERCILYTVRPDGLVPVFHAKLPNLVPSRRPPTMCHLSNYTKTNSHNSNPSSY